jgi:hypothetical protein
MDPRPATRRTSPGRAARREARAARSASRGARRARPPRRSHRTADRPAAIGACSFQERGARCSPALSQRMGHAPRARALTRRRRGACRASTKPRACSSCMLRDCARDVSPGLPRHSGAARSLPRVADASRLGLVPGVAFDARAQARLRRRLLDRLLPLLRRPRRVAGAFDCSSSRSAAPRHDLRDRRSGRQRREVVPSPAARRERALTHGRPSRSPPRSRSRST